MSTKYKVRASEIPHFITFTVVGWIDVFSRPNYRDIFLDSLRYCIDNKGLRLHAWVIMSNHVHLIVSSNENKIEHVVRDIKKFTASQIIKAIQNNPKESRKDWMLNIFGYAGRSNNNNKDYQFWKQDYHPIELSTSYLYDQRLNYLHENPVRAGYVLESWHYKYSSALDYFKGKQGLIKIEFLE